MLNPVKHLIENSGQNLKKSIDNLIIIDISLNYLIISPFKSIKLFLKKVFLLH